MQKLTRISTLASASVLAALALPAAVHATANPFHAQPIAGYQLADAAMTEGKCGGTKAATADEKKTAEGKCGGTKPAADKTADGSAPETAAAPEGKTSEGKCGEAKCGANKK